MNPTSGTGSPPGSPPLPSRPASEEGERPIAPRFIVFGVALLALVAAFLSARRDTTPSGNALVIVNAGASSLDSVLVEPDPPGQNAIAMRAGYVASQDSLVLPLAPGMGDAGIRVWRGGRVAAEHVAQFGGTTIFEVRVGDETSLGRYRRTSRPD